MTAETVAEDVCDNLTLEDLESLPVGSVVLCHGRVWQRYEPRLLGVYQYHQWMCPDGGFIRDGNTPTALIGARLIYQPKEQP